ncbi:MAG: nucleotidyltransferase family protein [Pirellulales bacterium]
MYRIGLILAAGRGRRMGRTKQLVMWPAADGEKPLVAAAYDTIRGACEEMIVVLGHEADAVAAALGDRPFHRVTSDPDAQMFDSIRAGMDAAQSIDTRATVVLQLGDHPQLSETTLSALVAAAEGISDRAILPEHRGRGGHPILIPPPVIARLLTADCPGGLARFWSGHPDLCLRISVDDPGVVMNVDTPAQLRQP